MSSSMGRIIPYIVENNPAMFETTNQHTKAKTPVTKPDPSFLKRSLVAERPVSNYLHTTISFACCWRQLSAFFWNDSLNPNYHLQGFTGLGRPVWSHQTEVEPCWTREPIRELIQKTNWKRKWMGLSIEKTEKWLSENLENPPNFMIDHHFLFTMAIIFRWASNHLGAYRHFPRHNRAD